MNYLTVYKKDNVYYYETVSCCFNEVGYVNGLGKELVHIEIFHNGRFYSLKDHENIFHNIELIDLKLKKRYKLFKNILYLLS